MVFAFTLGEIEPGNGFLFKYAFRRFLASRFGERKRVSVYLALLKAPSSRLLISSRWTFELDETGAKFIVVEPC